MPQSFRFENIDDVHNWLNTIPAFQQVGMSAANMSLKKITGFCKAMGDPHKKIKTIHVAGTNGKGATCAILSSVYSESGYKTGLFTSPHLISLNERFQIDGCRITDEEVLIFFREHGALLVQYPLTYFEITVAIAFWWFHRENVDIAVIETGLGGRLDATNIVVPLVSVITTIALDHTNYLGNSLEVISREKAGIVKPGIPVVTGNLTDDALGIVEQTAEIENSRIVKGSELHPGYKEGNFILQVSGQTQTFKSDLHAPVHRHNLAVAWQVIKVLNDILPVTNVDFRKGFQHAGRLMPGRFEKLHRERNWYFDGAHNEQALQALKETIGTIKPAKEAIVVFALMKDKIDENLINQFLGFKKNYYYTLKSLRAATCEDIRLSGLVAEPMAADEVDLFNLLGSFKSELVIFTGSFYFYSTVKEWLDQFIEYENNFPG